MMEVDACGIGGFDGVLAEEPAAYVMEHIDDDPRALWPRGGYAKLVPWAIRAVGPRHAVRGWAAVRKPFIWRTLSTAITLWMQ
jgi:hypothetical protein